LVGPHGNEIGQVLPQIADDADGADGADVNIAIEATDRRFKL